MLWMPTKCHCTSRMRLRMQQPSRLVGPDSTRTTRKGSVQRTCGAPQPATRGGQICCLQAPRPCVSSHVYACNRNRALRHPPMYDTAVLRCVPRSNRTVRTSSAWCTVAPSRAHVPRSLILAAVRCLVHALYDGETAGGLPSGAAAAGGAQGSGHRCVRIHVYSSAAEHRSVPVFAHAVCGRYTLRAGGSCVCTAGNLNCTLLLASPSPASWRNARNAPVV